MDEEQRAKRLVDIAADVRSRQQALEHDTALPAFLNFFTDWIVDTEEQLAGLEERLAAVEKDK